MNWSRAIPSDLEPLVRGAICACALEAFDDTIGWYSTDKGHDPQLFGSAITKVVRKLVEFELLDREGLAVERRGHVWRLLWEHEGAPYSLSIYKAKPGSLSVIDLEFKTEAKLQVPKGNSAQLTLDGLEHPAEAASHLMAVVFGDPDGGFDRVVVGAPIAVVDDNDKLLIEWAWSEELVYEPAPATARSAPDADSSSRDADSHEYGLRLKREETTGPESS